MLPILPLAAPPSIRAVASGASSFAPCSSGWWTEMYFHEQSELALSVVRDGIRDSRPEDWPTRTQAGSTHS